MTQFRFEHGPMVSACTLTAPDGGGGFVFCAIPGGVPQYQVSRDSRYASSVVNAPAMMTRREFERFVRERWADLAGEDDAAWVHDSQRDGAGCSWCGAYAQVNADNLCRDCWADDGDAS